MIPDILASRYASSEISEILSPEGKVLLEREFWIVVMKAQQKLGVDIPESAIHSYEKVKSQIEIILPLNVIIHEMDIIQVRHFFRI